MQHHDIRFHNKYSGLHDCARITASRLPNESVAAAVYAADAACQVIYEKRQALLNALTVIDASYIDAWDAAYERASHEHQ